MDTTVNPNHRYVIVLILIVATLAVYWQAGNHDFITYDDHAYIVKNSNVQAGLTRESIVWAFTTGYSGNWHPLTWLSHMLDCHLYGLNPKGHHLTNVFFHIANVLLLFLVFGRMTGALWQSAFVAALFALHPLHVESVAWAAERKDVLSTFFWMLTLWAYVSHVQNPTVRKYLLVVLALALGLMAKPMLVTLPFVLLLLDYWPLGRFQFEPRRRAMGSKAHKPIDAGFSNLPFFRLVLEKTPLLVLVTISSVVTFVAQKGGGAVAGWEVLPLNARIGNALVAYVSYIGKMIWPLRLAFFYPHPMNDLQLWQVGAAGLFLAGVTVLVIRAARRRPYLAVGWLWYLGTLVPVIGIVQVGLQSMADRYTYIPIIGLSIMIAWGIPDLLATRRSRSVSLAISAAVVLLACAVGAWAQVRHWRNSITLFEHALNVTARNWVAHGNLGIVLAGEGKIAEARDHYAEAIAIKPEYTEAHNNLGFHLANEGKIDEAIPHYWAALRLNPDYAEAHYNLGIALARQGKIKEATEHFSAAVRIRPDYAEAHNNLGIVLAMQGQTNEALASFAEALRIKPDFVEAQRNLDLARSQSKAPKP